LNRRDAEDAEKSEETVPGDWFLAIGQGRSTSSTLNQQLLRLTADRCSLTAEG